MIVAIGYNDNQPIDVVCTILIYNIKSGSFAAELRHMYMSPIYYTQIWKHAIYLNLIGIEFIIIFGNIRSSIVLKRQIDEGNSQ